MKVKGQNGKTGIEVDISVKTLNEDIYSKMQKLEKAYPVYGQKDKKIVALYMRFYKDLVKQEEVT